MTSRRNFIRQMSMATAAVAVTSSLKASEKNQDTLREPKGKTSSKDGISQLFPKDNGEALRNPSMGWTMHFYSNILDNYGSKLEPSDTLDYFPGLSTVFLRLPWAFIETEENVFHWEILDTPAQRWIDKGCKVAICVSSTESWMTYATPKWVFEAGAKGYRANTTFEPDYDDPIFLKKLENFVAALGKRYDQNPNVAFVAIGSYGMWGEGHTVMTTPVHGVSWTDETIKKHIDLYCQYFPHTQLCISDDIVGNAEPGWNFPITDYALQKGVTIKDDSILVQPYPRSWYHADLVQAFWPTRPVIIEHEHYGSAVARGSWDKELLMKSVEDYHASYMSIHWWPEIEYRDNKDVIERINRRMGYRIQLRFLQWPEKVRMGEPFQIHSEWANAGVAPCYPGGHPCFTLKDEKGGIVSVLCDKNLSAGVLSVDAPDKAPSRKLESTFRIGIRFEDESGTYHRACKPGTYDLFFSVGKEDGTPVLELPYGEHDGHKRYYAGKITVE